MSTSRDIRISRLEAAILDLWLPVTSDSIPNSTVRFLAPENMGVAVGMSLLLCLQVEINVFPDWRPPSWISDFRLRRTVFPIVPLDSLPCIALPQKHSRKIIRFQLLSELFSVRWCDAMVIQHFKRGNQYTKKSPFANCSMLLIYGAVSAERNPDLVELAATEWTKLAEYVGHCPVWIECIMVHSLYCTRISTGSQWSCREAVVIHSEVENEPRCWHIEAAWRASYIQWPYPVTRMITIWY